MSKQKVKQKELSIQDKFVITRQELGEALIERDEEIDVVLTGLVCRENPLLVGPPGTAKSLLLDSLPLWLGPDAKKFSVQFNKHTVPEEVFGPISIAGLEHDQYRRVTTNMLPEAHFAYFDEIFKASTATLNILLRILNERVFTNGDGQLKKVPLIMAVAASNEVPDRQELGALFDRFLLRKKVDYISGRSGRDKLLWTDDHTPSLSTSISVKEIEGAQYEAESWEFGENEKDAFNTIIDELNKEGIRPGDRRMFKAVKAVKAYAYVCGSETGVEQQHLEILKHILWDEPTEQPEKAAKIISRIANPTGSVITEKLIQVQDILEKNQNPTEIVTKLQEIHRTLKALPVSGQNEKRLQTAMNYVSKEIKAQYNKIVPSEV